MCTKSFVEYSCRIELSDKTLFPPIASTMRSQFVSHIDNMSITVVNLMILKLDKDRKLLNADAT